MTNKRRSVNGLHTATDIKPTSGPESQLVEFPLDRVLAEKVMWACNYFLLWNLGLTLRAHVETEEDQATHVARIDVAEWTYPKGEKIEMIAMSDRENAQARETFVAFVRERLLMMKPEERKTAIISLGSHNLIDLPGLILAE